MAKAPRLTPEQEKKLQDLMSDFQYYAVVNLVVEDKSAKTVQFKLNRIQYKVWKIIEDQFARGIPVRLCILKARQMGVSTFICGLFYWMISTRKNYKMAIITHLDEASRRLLEKTKFFYRNTPEAIRQASRSSNGKELILDALDRRGNSIGMNSRVEIKTAESPEQLRSGTYQGLHCSEVAFWNNAEKCALAAFQTVADEPGTIITIETTANGKGNYFHKLWTDKNDFTKLFFGWQEFPEHNREVPDGFKLTDDEEAVKNLYKLKMTQMAWRRWCIDNRCGGDVDRFMQEYPATAEEAFRATGNCRFSMSKLYWYSVNNVLKEPVFSGVVDLYGDELMVQGKNIDIKFEGGLRVWEPCIPRENYAIFADVSEGIVREDGKPCDRSGCDVVKINGDIKVAEWHGLCEPSDFGRIEVMLARQYNNAVIVQEINLHGHAAMTAIRKIERYPDSLIFGQRENVINDVQGLHGIGWLTTSKTRPQIINNLARVIDHKELGLVAKEDIDEMMTFIKRYGKEPAADINCFDDRVIKTAIREWLITRDFFIDQWQRQYEYWEFCGKCVHYNHDKYRCEETKRNTGIDDVCRLFEMVYDVSEYFENRRRLT